MRSSRLLAMLLFVNCVLVCCGFDTTSGDDYSEDYDATPESEIENVTTIPKPTSKPLPYQQQGDIMLKMQDMIESTVARIVKEASPMLVTSAQEVNISNECASALFGWFNGIRAYEHWAFQSKCR